MLRMCISSYDHGVMGTRSKLSGLLIGCGKKWEILRHFQGKLCGKKGLLCGKLCDFFKADLICFFRSQRGKPIFCCPMSFPQYREYTNNFAKKQWLLLRTSTRSPTSKPMHRTPVLSIERSRTIFAISNVI